MRSTKWMRSSVLATALLVVAGVMVVLACGPAAPAGQAGGGSTERKPTETPPPTPMLHPDCVTLTLPSGSKATSCPLPGPENIDVNLRRHYNDHMAAKERAAQDRRRSVAEPLYIGISVELVTHEAVDAVADFLEANGDGVVQRFKFGADHPRGRVGSVVSGYVDIELVPAIAAMDGVKRIKQNHPGELGYNRQSGGVTVANLIGVDD